MLACRTAFDISRQPFHAWPAIWIALAVIGTGIAIALMRRDLRPVARWSYAGIRGALAGRRNGESSLESARFAGTPSERATTPSFGKDRATRSGPAEKEGI